MRLPKTLDQHLIRKAKLKSTLQSQIACVKSLSVCFANRRLNYRPAGEIHTAKIRTTHTRTLSFMMWKKFLILTIQLL